VNAASLRNEAEAAGVTLTLSGSEVHLEAATAPTPDLLARLRTARAEVVEILQGDRCRWCGDIMGWPAPVGVVEGTGTALHHHCYDASEVERLLAAGRRVIASPDALADKAEMMLHGGPLP
jgi:hypothetical protein